VGNSDVAPARTVRGAACRRTLPWEEVQVNTRTIAIAALAIAVILLLIFLL
jgi:hypothetical protein